jgi:hypothetical protein
MIMKSQNATATLGNITSCAGEDILVPLDVLNFIDVGAMTIYIGYDTNAAEFLSIQNINPAIPGGISYNAADGQINIAYSNTNPFSIPAGKLFDLSFTYLNDSTLLPFNTGTEIANSSLEIIPLDTFTGSISNSIQLINQPDSVNSYPDNDVIFRVTSLGNPNYQWQENSGSDWIDLQDNEIYSGVTNDTLTVYDVPLSYNMFTYRCILSADECADTSDVALLEVALAFPFATLGYISSCPQNEVLEPVLVGDFFDVVEFTFNISFDTGNLTFQNLENIYPGLNQGDLSTSPLLDPPGLTIHWENTSPISVTFDKLFDLKFDYESLNHPFIFEEGTEVLNSSSNPVNITLNNGAISQYAVPLITVQPQNDTVDEFQSAAFAVEASETNEYFWLISTDGGNSWTDLTDTPPYYNVHTSTLTINPAVYSMNGYYYACRLENTHCTEYTNAAVLIVDTLTFIGDPGTTESFKVYPVPFHDKVNISLPAYYSCSSVCIYDNRGTILLAFNTNDQVTRELELDLSGLPLGLFFMKLNGTYEGKTAIETRKIVKTN